MSPFSCSRWDAHVIRRKKSRKRFESGSFLPPLLAFCFLSFYVEILAARTHRSTTRIGGTDSNM